MNKLKTLLIFALLFLFQGCHDEEHIKVPDAPVLLSPTQESGDIGYDPTLSWSPSKGAVSYTLQVATDNLFTNTIVNETDIHDLSYSISGLVSATYYWRVSATNAKGTSAWSSIWSFTTLLVVAPTLNSPATGSVDIPHNTVLTWNATGDALTYSLQVSTFSDFATTLVNETGLTDLNYDLMALTSGEKFYWHVSATNNLGTSNWSDVWNFTTYSIPTDNLVAYYPFNGNSDDESGNENNGTANGATLTSDRFENINSAFYFSGTDDISINSSDELNLIEDITLSVWFNSEGPPTFSTAHTFISKLDRDSPGGITVPYLFCINYQLGIPSDYKKPMFVAADGTIQYLQSENDITNNTWNHAVAVINGNNLKIYVNNILNLDTTIDNSNRATNLANVLIGSGNRDDAPAEFMIGKLDDIRIYNRALTALEIQALYYE